MPIDTKKYLEYLDKEMTIMGILSAVAIAAPAGILNVLLSDKNPFKDQLLAAGPFFVMLGSVSCILAALSFYGERSMLAWYYGQICLTEALDSGITSSQRAEDLMVGADSWETWIRYQWGFATLITGFVEYVAATFFALSTPHSHLYTATKIIGRAFPFLALLYAILQWHVYKTYRLDEEPWQEFWSSIFHTFRRKLPHENVYARLQSSPIAGVGVFAIRDIPKDTYVFEPDDDALVEVRKSRVENLPLALRRLYEDFCVLKNGTYKCPSSFNKLTPSWYLNMSENPNLAADSSLKFYAIREIKAGEELTSDYSTYSENELTSQT
ncbi:MAG TPA: SET domain-containing protein [Verrucomicrobiae bacterium]|nr:SET domain-containing protein [Verrucomicrobiae bacterium]